MSYKVYKVGRGVNAPTKRWRTCMLCGCTIIDFRIEKIIDGKKHYLCIHCPIQTHHGLIYGNTWKHKLARWLLPKMLYAKEIVKEEHGG